MKKCYTLLLSIFLLATFSSYAAVTGDTSVCKGDIETYHVPVVAGASYSWSITAGSAQGPTNVDSATIQWNTVGVGTIIVTVNNPFGPPTYYTLNVNIHPKPTPAIAHAAYPTCPIDTGRNGSPGNQPDHQNCEKVCKFAVVTYATTFHAGNTYLWVATGNTAITGANTNSPTVYWDSTHFGTLTVYETNTFGCMDSATICIEKMDLPVANFTHIATVCRNSSTLFTNNSTNATSYFWTFGDGGTSTATSPTHQYANAGTYTITLIAENDCHCKDTFASTITVDSLPGPVITCPATLCANAIGVYSTNNTTGCVYNWFAVGGVITAGQGTPVVTVQWGPGQLGQLGLYVTGCGAVCNDTTIIQVPIVPLVATITGPNKVCAGDCEYYYLPRFSGATFHWTIGTGCGVISDSTCCEKVQVCWSSNLFACADTLKVTYYDSLLHCGGTAQIIIHLRPKLEIFGNATACANNPSIFNTSGGIVCTWSVTPAGPTYSPGPSPSLTVNWNNIPGNYVVTAVPVNPNQVCNDSTKLLIHVVAPPVKPVITGDTIICPNSQVSYCATGASMVNWNIVGGTPLSAVGNCITVSWGGSGPYILKAFVKDPQSPFCSSDTAVQNVYVAVAGPPALIGASPACANGTYSYSTTTLYPAGTTYTWSMSPSNAGSVQSPGSPSTMIEWGNNAPQNVTVTLTVNVCGNILSNTLVVALKPIPTPTVIQTGNLCAGGSAQLQALGGTYTVNWSGPSGTSTSNPYSITLAGLYQVTVTDVASGCQAHTQKNVTYVSGPIASISTADPTTYCTGTAFTVNICALGNPNYTYAWSNAAITQCTSVSTPGSYSVVVTDVTNGCTATSNIIGIASNPCTGTGGGGCTPNASAQVSFTHTLCNPISFNNTSISASNFNWDFGDLSTSNVTSPTHTYAFAGFYLVVLSGDVPNAAGTGFCREQDTAHIEIPLAARFDTVVGCNGAPVCFTDISTHTAGNNITGWSWNFGDASPLVNTQNACHTYAGPGRYTVTLTITNGTCSATYTQTITVPNPPNAAFTVSNPNCINNPVTFTDGSSPSINYWSWTFGDGGTSLNQSPTHTYNVAATYLDTLIVSNIFGCRDTATASVVVNSPTLTGNITAYPDTIVCAGIPVTLVAPTCLTCTYLWNTGSTNDSIVVTTTGIYTVTITDGNGCPYSTYIRIIVNNGPPAEIFNNGSDDLCLGDYRYLSTTYNANWVYNWVTNDGVNNGATNYTIYVQPAVTGVYTYHLQITDTTTGCSDTSLVYTLTVHALPVPPTITATGPSTICHGDTILLVGTHPDPSINLIWNTGVVNDSLYVTENGCYHYMATDTFGCKSQAIYCETVNPLPETCPYWEGCLDTCTPFTIHAPYGNNSYQWLLNGVPIGGATLPYYSASVSGVYSVILGNNFGCIDTTGDLNLTLHECGCAQFFVDSVGCDSLGNHIVHYHVQNNSPIMMTQVNLEMLAPHLTLPYAPNVVFTNINPGAMSDPLSTVVIGNPLPNDTVCFRAHVSAYDSTGLELLCCYTDTQCVTLPPCPKDTACCKFVFVGDSIWCEQTAVGTKYNFKVRVRGCGSIVIQSPNAGTLNVTNPYPLVAGNNDLYGSYISATDTVLCLTFIMSNGGHICKDTTICFPINCNQHPLPCHWDYNRSVCQGDSTFFGYYGNPAGLTITWSFPGGTPATATGPGPHYVHYNTPGMYPFTMTLTNGNGTTTCTDSITVVARPVATVTQVGNALNALPGGMYYRWYNGTPAGTGIAGATNQFYNPPVTGYYCVVVTNQTGCSDTACLDFVPRTGIDELAGGAWNLFPNPNEGSFTLSLTLVTNEQVEMKIVNTIGEVIDQRVFDGKSGAQSFFITNKNFASGIYFVQLKTQNGISTKRMIIR